MGNQLEIFTETGNCAKPKLSLCHELKFNIMKKKDKQIQYSKEEQDAIQKCITTISSILIDKKYKGFDSPIIKGSVNVKNENIKISFSISAESIENIVF